MEKQEIIALDEALGKLKVDERKAQVVELPASEAYNKEIAEVLSIQVQ